MVVIPSISPVLPPAPVPQGFFLVQTSPVRGHRYHARPEWLLPLKPGTPLVLVAEPANPHDRYAVRVQTEEGNHLGYLPRESNHVVSRLLRQGAPITGMVAWASPENDPPFSLWVLLAKGQGTGSGDAEEARRE